MLELADVFERFGADLQSQYADGLLPSHKKAFWDICHCRTDIMGGQTYLCPDCNHIDYSYHSCQNRSCPKCGNDRSTQWLRKQADRLLPVPYFMVTFTLPCDLRQAAYRQQKEIYDLMFQSSSSSIMELVQDKRFVGASVGMMGVLQTWARNIAYHPHIHYLVPAIAFDDEHLKVWLLKKNYLCNEEALALIFKAKMQEELLRLPYLQPLSKEMFQKRWVVNVQSVGYGMQALKYIAPYVFRVAISNQRLVSITDQSVSFRYQESDSKKWRIETIPGVQFIRRFLCHVLPKGFVKVRYYGFLAPSQKRKLLLVRKYLACLFCLLLHIDLPTPKILPKVLTAFICKICGTPMQVIQRWPKFKIRPHPALRGV